MGNFLIIIQLLVIIGFLVKRQRGVKELALGQGNMSSTVQGCVPKGYQ